MKDCTTLFVYKAFCLQPKDKLPAPRLGCRLSRFLHQHIRSPAISIHMQLGIAASLLPFQEKRQRASSHIGMIRPRHHQQRRRWRGHRHRHQRWPVVRTQEVGPLLLILCQYRSSYRYSSASRETKKADLIRVNTPLLGMRAQSA